MGARAEREVDLSAPISFDWCNLPDPSCPYKDGRCGIKEWLRKWPRRRWKKEAKRLYEIAKKNPEGFRQTCEEGLWGW